MWRKPDTKPSSDTAGGSGSIPPRMQPLSSAQIQQSSFERPTAAPASPRTAETMSPDASRIGAGIKIRGEISGNSDVYLDGEANGKIRVMGARVTVGPQGKVQADIDAREIVVNGSVDGNLKAESRLRLGASSRVQGALTAPSIGVDDGAKFRGKVEVTRSKPAVAAPESEASADAELLMPVGVNAEGE